MAGVGMFPSRTGSAIRQFTIDAGGYFGPAGGTQLGLASAAFPTANKVLYIPIRIPSPVKILQLYAHNGATASGNVDIGIYAEDGTRIVSSGSTAQAGTSADQLFNVADTQLGRGLFYIGLTLSNTTGTFSRVAPSLAILKAIGLLTETPGSFGLPAVASFGAYVDAYFPMCGILAQSAM